MDWHVVAVEPSSEGMVSRRADELGIEAYVPKATKLVRTRAKRRVEFESRIYPAIPGYVFVKGGRADQYRREWERPDTVPHCLGLLGVDGPEPVAAAVVEGLREREQRGDFSAVVKLGRYVGPRWIRTGKPVKVVEGPMRGRTGRIWRMTRLNMLAIWVLVMGRETLTEVPVGWVERARGEADWTERRRMK
jgi:transcription antitermination factor NusG